MSKLLEGAIADDLMLGAGKIAAFLYGEDKAETRRDIYRNPMGLSFFKHGATIAALKSTIRAELLQAQQAAQEERRRKKKTTQAVVTPRRRRARHMQAAAQ